MSEPVALITGAASGIGQALAIALARRGWAIAAVDCQREGLIALEKQAGSLQKRCAWAVADVTCPEVLRDKVRELEQVLGPAEMLVACAGVGVETSAHDLRPADVARVIDVNLTGVAHSIAAVLPGMRERRRGHLVAMSSVASLHGLPRLIAYSASKAGLNVFMEGLRAEVRPWGLHVTIICPGWVRTPMTAPLHDRLPEMLDLDTAVDRIVWAIETKRPWFAFPWRLAWRLRLISALPYSWQDAILGRMSQKLDRPAASQ
jgi:NAD(P)-dependent dehydrogenase (short-subunit alcohol dehydrogenase family)